LGTLSAENYFDYKEFCKLIKWWSQPTTAFRDRCRYYKQHNIVHALTTCTETRKMVKTHEKRYVQKWSSMASFDLPSFVAEVRPGEPYNMNTSASPDVLAIMEAQLMGDGKALSEGREKHANYLKTKLMQLHNHRDTVNATSAVCLATNRCDWGTAWTEATSKTQCDANLKFLREKRQLDSTVFKYVQNSMRGAIGELSISLCITHQSWLVKAPTLCTDNLDISTNR
jgi:hypothetical protein